MRLADVLISGDPEDHFNTLILMVWSVATTAASIMAVARWDRVLRIGVFTCVSRDILRREVRKVITNCGEGSLTIEKPESTLWLPISAILSDRDLLGEHSCESRRADKLRKG
jgi:hypothetical protein